MTRRNIILSPPATGKTHFVLYTERRLKLPAWNKHVLNYLGAIDGDDVITQEIGWPEDTEEELAAGKRWWEGPRAPVLHALQEQVVSAVAYANPRAIVLWNGSRWAHTQNLFGIVVISETQHNENVTLRQADPKQATQPQDWSLLSADRRSYVDYALEHTLTVYPSFTLAAHAFNPFVYPLPTPAALDGRTVNQ